MLLLVQADACNEELISKYAPLSDAIHMGVKSVRKAVEHLEQEKWVDIKQDTRVKPFLLKICNPVRNLFEDMKVKIVKQLNRGRFRGGTIVRVVSMLFVDTKCFEDDSSPGYLENPYTGRDCSLTAVTHSIRLLSSSMGFNTTELRTFLMKTVFSHNVFEMPLSATFAIERASN